MSTILTLPRSFGSTLVQVSKETPPLQNIPSGSFTLVTMNTIISDAGSNWDAAQNNYVVPSAGLYQITGSLRTEDVQSSGIPFGLGVHPSNSDGTWFLWHAVQTTINPEHRTTYPYIRTGTFAAGDRLRMFTYSDQGYLCSSVVLNIFRVA